jgi:hypothetical protein
MLLVIMFLLLTPLLFYFTLWVAMFIFFCFFFSIQQFYSDTAGVAHLEQLDTNKLWTVKVNADNSRDVNMALTPVGVEREPTVNEIRQFMKDIIHAIKICGDKGWAIVDVRWSNIVYTNILTGWIIIDASEHATKIGQPLPNVILSHGLAGTNADKRTDIYQLRTMISSKPALQNSITSDVGNGGQVFWNAMAEGRTPAQLQKCKYLQP